jgi:hypothetical protein
MFRESTNLYGLRTPYFKPDEVITILENLPEDLPVNITVVVGVTVIIDNKPIVDVVSQVPDKFVQTNAPIDQEELVKSLATVGVILKDNVIIPVVTSENVDLIEELTVSKVTINPIQVRDSKRLITKEFY